MPVPSHGLVEGGEREALPTHGSLSKLRVGYLSCLRTGTKSHPSGVPSAFQRQAHSQTHRNACPAQHSLQIESKSFCYALDCLEGRIMPTKGFLLDYSAPRCMLASSLQLCPTLCYPMVCSPPGSSVHRIFQARILEWVTMPSSRGSSHPRDRTQVSYAS